MNGRMPLLERGDLVPAGAWYPITVETFDLAHTESRRMPMESWIEALTSDHSREAALSVLAKVYSSTFPLEELRLGAAPIIKDPVL